MWDDAKRQPHGAERCECGPLLSEGWDKTHHAKVSESVPQRPGTDGRVRSVGKGDWIGSLVHALPLQSQIEKVM